MEALTQKFQTLKAEFQKQQSIVEEKLEQQDKNKQLLQAYKNELEEIHANSKLKLEQGEQLTADEYVELKQSDTGLKARIEYHSALNEELEKFVYTEKKKLFDIQQEMKSVRALIFSQKGKAKLKEFVANNQEILDEIFTLFYFSSKFEQQYDLSTEKEEATLAFMQSFIVANIDRSPKAPSEFSLYSKCLEGFSEKRPTQIYKESLENKPSGFSKLLQNLMGE